MIKDPPTYDEYKKWLQDQGIKTHNEFRKFDRSKFPPGCPKDPRYFYKKQGTWKGFSDLFGRESPYLTNAPSYEEFKKWVQDQGIKNQKEFRRLDKIKFPPGYSKRPDYYYKKQGTWKGWNDLCGTEQYFLLTAPSYEEYKKWLQDQGIKTQTEFRKFDKSKFPPGYPKEPSKFYKKEYKGMGDMLGTGTVAPQNLEWPSPIEARIAIKKIAKDVFGGNAFTQRDWINAHKAGKIPASLPRYLDTIYDPNVRKRRKRQNLADREGKRKKK